MERITQAKITGNKGLLMAWESLSGVALVNPYWDDIGLDLHCELYDDPSCEFLVQAKGSVNPTYTETTIHTLQVECKTVEQYWMKKPAPVFLFMSDITQNRIFYTVVDRNTYQPRRTNQKKYTFSIPLTNEITPDNISVFVACVIENRFNITKEERERFLLNHSKKNRELFRDLPEEKDRFLEIMRGSDQTAQVEVKMLLKQRYEEGIPIPGELRNGLFSIFINSKDRITQSHTLDTLVYINETAVVPQIIKQINRNIRHYEYIASGGRSHDIDFLFQALVRFKSKNTVKDLIRFLNSKDPNILRGAARTCGELGLNEAVPQLLTLLSHHEDYVRHEASRALRLLIDTKTVSKLTSMLANPSTPLQLEGAIRAIAETEDPQHASTVVTFASHLNSAVRVATAFCLGKTDPINHIPSLGANDD